MRRRTATAYMHTWQSSLDFLCHNSTRLIIKMYLQLDVHMYSDLNPRASYINLTVKLTLMISLCRTFSKPQLVQNKFSGPSKNSFEAWSFDM